MSFADQEFWLDGKWLWRALAINLEHHAELVTQNSELLEIMHDISPSIGTKDVFRWRNNIYGYFSIKSCYSKVNVMTEEEMYEVEVLTTLKHVLFSCVPSKIKIFS